MENFEDIKNSLKLSHHYWSYNSWYELLDAHFLTCYMEILVPVIASNTFDINKHDYFNEYSCFRRRI